MKGPTMNTRLLAIYPHVNFLGLAFFHDADVGTNVVRMPHDDEAERFNMALSYLHEVVMDRGVQAVALEQPRGVFRPVRKGSDPPSIRRLTEKLADAAQNKWRLPLHLYTTGVVYQALNPPGEGRRERVAALYPALGAIWLENREDCEIAAISLGYCHQQVMAGAVVVAR